MNTPGKSENAALNEDFLNLNNLVKLIPNFDTTNPQEVYKFIRSCNSAFELASEPQKPFILVYALNNITGPNAADVHCRKFNTWHGLREFLVDKFSNTKTLSHLNLELQSMFQGQNESLTDYYHRVDLCRNKIIEKLNIEITDKTLLGRLATTEETALNVFINGFSSDIGIMLRTKGFKNLSEAGNFAKQEDKIRAMNNARQLLFKPLIQNSSRPLTRPNFNRPQTNSISRPQHNPSIRPQNNAPPTGQITSAVPKFCNYCKYPGHIISECRKRAYNNQRAQNITQRSLPTPNSFSVNHLNSQAAAEMGTSSETALVPLLAAPRQTLQTQNIDENLIQYQ